MTKITRLIFTFVLLVTSPLFSKEAYYLGVLEHDEESDKSDIILLVDRPSKSSRSSLLSIVPIEWTICEGGAKKELTLFKGNFPWTGTKTTQYARWGGQATYKPLIAGVGISCEDPDKWGVYKPTPEEMNQLGAFLMGDIGNIYIDDGTGGPSKPYQYSSKDLKVEQAFVNRMGIKIIRLGLSLPANQKVLDMVGDSLGRLFVIDVNGKIQNLGEQLQFLDAGDYDKDGKGEIVFFYSGYNQDGYELRDLQMKVLEKVRWSYH